MIALLMIMILMLLIALIFITRVRLLFSYQRIREQDHCVIEVTAWFGLIRYKYEVPVIKLLSGKIKLQREVETSAKNAEPPSDDLFITDETIKYWTDHYEEIIDQVHNFFPTLRDFLKHLQCKEIAWHTKVGIGDAAATGTLTGIVWSVKSMILASLTRYVTLRTFPRLSVQPEWNGIGVRTEVRCIFTVRVGHIIVAGIRILLKLRKGRERKWKTTPSRA
ncbi:DUF2953 domain-containing protein [Brevibacillus ginsengisoli]|uniref:DUF2953 domain-containing protein n=1 Tax=Brevibacillus ginsengisoli TaxID=363854 RepID=UPI003CECDEF0